MLGKEGAEHVEGAREPWLCWVRVVWCSAVEGASSSSGRSEHGWWYLIPLDSRDGSLVQGGSAGCCVTAQILLCPVRNTLMFVLTPLCLSALGKGIRDGGGCAPFSAFCVLLLLWWESPDGSFDSFPRYFYFCVSTIVFSLKEVLLIFRKYFVFRMLFVAQELIYCFDPSRFDPEIKALLLSADVSEREFLRNF